MASILEQQILAAVFYDPSIVTKQQETLLQAMLSEPIKTILTKVLDHNNASEKQQSENLEQALTAEELQYAQQMLFKVESSNIKQMFDNLMIQFQKKHWKSLASHIKMKTMQAKQTNNKKEMQELIDVFESLKKDLYKNGRL